MRHLVSGRKLKRTSSHRKALLSNLATALFEHKRIVTTEAKAKELRPYAEHLITKARHALSNERAGLLPEGQSIDIHNRRVVSRHLKSKAVLQELFDAIAPVVESRNGGYTRIVKLGHRRGDAGVSALIELIDWAAPQDGRASTSGKKKAKSPAKKKEVKAAKPAATPAPVAEVVPVAEVEETPAVVEVAEAPIAETPVQEVPAAEAEAPKMVFDDTTEGEEENKA